MPDSSRRKITIQSLLDEFFAPSRIRLISVVGQHTLKSERNQSNWHFFEVAGIHIGEIPYTSGRGRGEMHVLKWQQIAKSMFLFCHF